MGKISAVGDTVPIPGKVQLGRWEMLVHPTGNPEFLPVIIVQGKQDGPCLWLTAGIHGDEHSGPAVIYRLLTPDLAANLHGTLIAIPALNPVGLRTRQRQSYLLDQDPNRLWPDGRPEKKDGPDQDPPSAIEESYKRLFEVMLESADYMIDFHAAWTGSIPFAFRDRILFQEQPNGDQGNCDTPISGMIPTRDQAQELSTRQLELLQAFGHTIILEMPVEKLFDQDLHRSTSGALLYQGQIPAFTVELGTGEVPESKIVNAAKVGTRNLMRYIGMLDDDVEPVTGIPVIDPGYPLRRCTTPRVQQSCIILHLSKPGDWVQVGEAVAEIRDVWGQPIGDGFIRSEYEGVVLGNHHGIYYYPGQAIMTMGIANDAPIISPYPKGYFSR